MAMANKTKRFFKSLFQWPRMSAVTMNPSVPIIQEVVRLARLTFLHGASADHLSKNLSRLQATVAQVCATDVGLVVPDDRRLWTPDSPEAPVTYTEIREDDRFTLGIFALRNGARIPLHDHPDMHGVIKVLYGTLDIRSYTRVGPNDDAGSVPVDKSDALLATPDSGSVCLHPIEGNFHEIRAVDGPAAFLDVLAPPYDQQVRECRFYVSETGRIGTRLLEVDQPTDYWCDSKPYRGPVIEL